MLLGLYVHGIVVFASDTDSTVQPRDVTQPVLIPNVSIVWVAKLHLTGEFDDINKGLTLGLHWMVVAVAVFRRISLLGSCKVPCTPADMSQKE